MAQTRIVPTAALAASLVLPAVSLAQTHQHSAAEKHRERYIVPAVHVDQPPHIDGVLDDQVWQRAPVLNEFTQQEPREGAPATERTEVRILYDSRSLLIAVRAFDTQAAGIVATEMRRDSDRLLDEDNVQLILDTFNDSRNGYMFVANLSILRVDYALSPRTTVRSLTQFNSSTREVTSSVRFNFIYRPGSDLYVVYNDLPDRPAAERGHPERPRVRRQDQLSDGTLTSYDNSP